MDKMENILPESVALTPEQIKVGLQAQFVRAISEEQVLAFARISGDATPLHMDENHARQSNFGRRIVHGAFQLSPASAFVAMRLPGRNALLGSVNAKFPSPLYFPCRARVQGQIIGLTGAQL